MSYFNFDNKKIYYSESGSGTPLLFLHGNTASSNMFLEISKLYERDFNVILIDFLGHGKSDRLIKFPSDLWYFEAQQVIAFLKEKNYPKVNLIGSSGGALVAINVALEAPDLVSKVIVDSFEGEKPIKTFTDGIFESRKLSKEDNNAKMFYYFMQGNDWEQVVDNDTDAIIRHQQEIGIFFHKDISSLKPDILLCGSSQDEFVSGISEKYFTNIYGEMIKKIGHGRMHIFHSGGHPAMLTNQNEFYKLSIDFLNNRL